MSSDWPDARLEDLITVKHGFAFKGEHFTDQSTVHQLVTPGNFAIGGGFQLGKPKFYSGPVPPDYVLNRGDVVVTMTDLSRGGDTLGFAGAVPETPGTVWLHNQRIGLVQMKPGAPVHAGYLRYMMRSAEYRHWVVSTATGSTVRHTSPGRICSYGFKLPPAAEQIGIEAILTALDDRIALLRETNATLEAVAQALFKSWFVDFDPVRAKSQGLAPAGMDEATLAVFPDSFEDSQRGSIPAGWSVKPIHEFASVIYGAPFASSKFNGEGIGRPLIRIRDLRDEAPGVCTPEVHIKGYVVRAADIVVGMDGEFRADLWGGEQAWLNQRVCVFAPKPGAPAAFVRSTIEPLLAHVEATETATTVIHLGKNDIDRFRALVPGPGVLLAFASVVDPV